MFNTLIPSAQYPQGHHSGEVFLLHEFLSAGTQCMCVRTCAQFLDNK